MYRYDLIDRQFVAQRVAEFEHQLQRHLAGQLDDERFRPLRLKNGLYSQRHAYMIRLAIPYGLLSSRQLRVLAEVAESYDRGVGHFTTRQNLQLNWVQLAQSASILKRLAEVEMHAIQTSGNCIRNITSDVFAGVAPDEVVDPRPICELLRQWSSLHPEFSYLPRKFKLAVSGASTDRVLLKAHDIGLQLKRDERGEVVVDVWVGGGMGRTPLLGHLIKAGLPWSQLGSYLSAVLRTYNRFGRRDNLYKARIKILVKALGPGEFGRQVEAQWQRMDHAAYAFDPRELERIAGFFVEPEFPPVAPLSFEQQLALAPEPERAGFGLWLKQQVYAQRQAGYAAVSLSLKSLAADHAPGDATAEQMRQVAQMSEDFGDHQIRVSHEQNLVLAHVPHHKLYQLWLAARAAGVAEAHDGLLTDVVCCPGGDFCSLANARSIPVAKAIAWKLADKAQSLGRLSLKVSGCMNACGHHGIGNIGILGVDKDDTEWYQLSLGGRDGDDSRFGKVIGPSFAAEGIVEAVAKTVEVFEQQRLSGENFVDTYERIGSAAFKAALYPAAAEAGHSPAGNSTFHKSQQLSAFEPSHD